MAIVIHQQIGELKFSTRYNPYYYGPLKKLLALESCTVIEEQEGAIQKQLQLEELEAYASQYHWYRIITT